jgi:chromosome partitioning protein
MTGLESQSKGVFIPPKKGVIICLVNQKGGTGKTTSAVNIGAGLARLGQKVLLIDLDPQANLSYHLGIKSGEIKASVAEVLEGRARPEAAVIERAGLDVIPSTLALAETEARIFDLPGRERLLSEPLARIKSRYSYILIDCPPNLGVLTLNALVGSDKVFIPIEVQALPLQGLRAIDGVIGLVRERLNPELRIAGIIATRYDGRKILNREVLDTIREHFGHLVFKTVIRDTVRLAEAPGYGLDIFSYAPRSYGAEDYLSLCKEILKTGKGD